MLPPPNPIPAGCPWHGLSQYGLPNVDWCEAYVCAYVNEPANAWSNLAYVAVALWMLRVLRGVPADAPNRPALRRFAPATILVGAASFVYHATNTHLTQIFDFFGMYVFCFLLLVLNLQRLGWLAAARFPAVFWSAVLGTTAVTFLLARRGAKIQALVALCILEIVVTELLAFRASIRRGARYALHPFLVSLGLLIAGSVFSVLDVTRTLCDPQNHFFQGHAAWHVLSALSLGAAFWHYRGLGAAAGPDAPAR